MQVAAQVLRNGLAAGVGFVLMLLNGGALAQEGQSETGIVLGSFLLLPSFTLGAEYNDNIFAEETDERADLFFTASPAVSLQSDWGRHALGVYAAAVVNRYLDNTREDNENFSLTMDGRVDVTRDTNIFAGAGIELLHEDRGSPDDVNGEVPTEFSVAGAQIGVLQNWARVSARADARVRQFDYDDVPAAGAVINNDDRDRTEFEGSLRGAYEILPGYEAFIEGRLISRNYDDPVDDAGFQRDSDGYNVNAGVAIDITGLVFGDFFAGYWSQDYEDPSFGASDSLSLGADINWNVTPLTTLRLGVARSIEETTLVGAASFTATRISLSADHELLRNLLLNADVTGTRNDYENIERTDDIVSLSVGVTYLMSRYVHLSAGYSFAMRDSDAAGFDYDRNSVIIRVRLQF